MLWKVDSNLKVLNENNEVLNNMLLCPNILIFKKMSPFEGKGRLNYSWEKGENFQTSFSSRKQMILFITIERTAWILFS